MKQVFVTPREGTKVRDEQGKGHIPAEGAFRMQSTYINRRIADGDLIIRDEEKVSADAPASAPKTPNHKKG